MACKIKTRTEWALKDLHARELMRLGWYRQFHKGKHLQRLRERKAQHTAFLLDLLRKRKLGPVWYARFFYYLGHLLGWMTAFLPLHWSLKIESILEFWILLRYEKYLNALRLQRNLRSMVEALQLKKLNHNEPDLDVLQLLEKFYQQQKQLVLPEQSISKSI